MINLFYDSSFYKFIQIVGPIAVVVYLTMWIWHMISLYRTLRERGRRVDMAITEIKVALAELERDPRGEARLAIAEKDYVERVKMYNQQVSLIQSHLISRIFKVKRCEILTIDELKKSKLMVK